MLNHMEREEINSPLGPEEDRAESKPDEKTLARRRQQKAWREMNPVSFNESQRRYRERNREKIRARRAEYWKKYYEKNRERLRETTRERLREYREKNKELLNARRREKRAAAQRSARKKPVPV